MKHAFRLEKILTTRRALIDRYSNEALTYLTSQKVVATTDVFITCVSVQLVVHKRGDDRGFTLSTIKPASNACVKSGSGMAVAEYQPADVPVPTAWRPCQTTGTPGRNTFYASSCLYT